MKWTSLLAQGWTKIPGAQQSTILVGIGQLKNLQGKKIILQCRIGGRSMRACQLLQAEGLEHDVWNLEGGIDAWKEAGYKVQT